MASQAVESHRAGAEVVRGHDACKKRSIEFLEEAGLPKGFFPLSDMEEFGYNRETGFVWILQKESTTHNFQKTRQIVSYGTEVTAFVENRKIKEVTGIKTKDRSKWITVLAVYTEKEYPHETLAMQISTNLSFSFHAAAFDLGE